VRANVHARSLVAYWQDAYGKMPHHETTSVSLGKAYLAEGDVARARAYLFGPRVVSIRQSCLAMAEYYRSHGAPLPAIVHVRIAEREAAYGRLFQSTTFLMGRILYSARAFDYAEHHLAWVLAGDPCNTTALKLLADAFTAKGFYPAALRCREDAVAIQPDDPENTAALADLRRRMRDPEDYPLVNRMVPPNPDWLRYAVHQGATPDMRREVVALDRVYPDDPVILLVSASFLSELGEHAAALEKMDRVVEALPSYPFAWLSKCWAATNAGDVRRAVATADAVKHLRPVDAEAWDRFAYAREQAGQYDVAIASYRTAIRGDPKMRRAYRNLAGLLRQRGDFRDALPLYRRVLALGDDRKGDVHADMGYVLMRLDEDDAAMAAFTRSIAIDPSVPATYRRLSIIHERRGRYARCVEILSKALEVLPDDPGLRSDLAKILATAPDDALRDGPRAVTASAVSS